MKKQLHDFEYKKSFLQGKNSENSKLLKEELSKKDRLIKESLEEIENLKKENNSIKNQMLQLINEADIKYKLLFDNANDAIFLFKDDAFIECNNVTLNMFGCERKEQIIGKHPHEFSPEYQPNGLKSTDQALQKIQLAFNLKPQFFEWVHKRLNGETFDAEVSLNGFNFSGETYLLAIVRDVTKRKRLAYYDHLTNLPNRIMFFERAHNILENKENYNQIKSLLYLDLDRFKSINDTMGHNFADELLIAFSKRIKNFLREKDFIARIGGDEFVIFLSDLGHDFKRAKNIVEKISNKLLHISKHPYNLPSGDMHIALSIGVTVFEVSKDISVDAAIQEADLAMYHAKHEGGNKVKFYNKLMKEKFLKRLFLEKSLRKCISEKNLKVEYQPIFNDKFEIVSLEALSRWTSPSFGKVDPELFIAIAEESGLINQLGFNMLDTALSDINNLNSSLKENKKLELSVNISPFQLDQSSFIKDVKYLMEKHKVKKNFLSFEITENIFISDIEMAMGKLTKLRGLGVRILLDDFGTGYSSLNFASKLAINGIKVDKSFIDDLKHEKGCIKMLEIFLSIGKHLKLDVIAEGVEEQSQLEELKKIGFKKFQGFLFSKPLKIGALYDFLNKNL